MKYLVCLVFLLSACQQPSPTSDTTTRTGSIEPPAAHGLLAPRRLLSGTHTHDSGSESAAPVLPASFPSPARGASLHGTCKSSDLIGLTGPDLVDYLQSATCDLYYLWTFDQHVQTSLTNANMQAVAGAVAAAAPSYDGTSSGGMRSLLFYLRVGYYHSYYAPVTFTPATLTAVAAGLDAFGTNEHLNDFTPPAAAVLYEWINCADAAVLSYRYLVQFEAILTAFPARSSDYDAQVNTYAVLFSIARQTAYKPFKAAVDQALIDHVRDFTRIHTLPGFLTANAVYALGQIAFRIPARKQAAVAALASVYDDWPHLSEPSLWAIKALSLYNGCQPIGVCLSDVAPQLLASIIPHEYQFEGITMRTGIGQQAAADLVNSTCLSQLRFLRLAQTVNPVTDDPNPVLHSVVYRTRKDYEVYQPLLFDIDPNNGGIYIEQKGTLYTYERLPSESIYTLEELFRHEYIHYLVGRFVVVGMWGAVPIYAGGRMVPIDEGMAEAMGWSGVREKLVRQVAQENTHMTVAEIFASRYSSGFRFYPYAGLLVNYLQAHAPEKLTTLLAAAHAGDGPAFDAIVQGMAGDAALEASYQQFLDEQIAALP